MMNSGNLLKQPFQDSFLKCLSEAKTHVNERRWDKATRDIKETQSIWDKVVKRVQFSVERDEINNLQHSLARLKGYIEARDQPGAFAELEEVKETWNDLGK